MKSRSREGIYVVSDGLGDNRNVELPQTHIRRQQSFGHATMDQPLLACSNGNVPCFSLFDPLF